MANQDCKPYVLFFCCILVVFPIWFSQCRAAADAPPSPPSSPVSTTTICKSTPYPSYCQTVLPNNNSSSNAYDYGRFSVRKSLSAARKFLLLIQKYLRNSKSLTITAVRALQDCEFLAGLNMDYLSSSFNTVNSTSGSLPVVEADDVQTLLSAILTNTQTCTDGLQATSSAWSIRNGIVAPLANDTRLFSVSLALFTKAWVPKKKKKAAGKWHPTGFKNGRLPLKMSARTKAIFERVSRRKLLQVQQDNQVLVSDIVVVSQDGSENFTSINDAVAAAPNNTQSTDGYFLVYVKAGVYEEYVSIAKNKKYLMMIGDGINQTIITGNHSYVDGWTTFNSSTFGKYLFTCL